MNSRFRHRRRSRGQAFVEFAVILPVLMLILLTALDFGRLFAAYITVSNAAREGAFYAVQHSGDLAGAKTAAKREDADPLATVKVCPGDAPCTALPAGMVSVTVSQPFTFWTPIIGAVVGKSLTLSVTASGDWL